MDDTAENENNSAPSQNNSSGLSEIFASPTDSSDRVLKRGKKRSASPDTDDSLVDFKSSKLTVPPQIIPKIPLKKVKKPTKKRPAASKTTRETNQQLIESSFFKSKSPKASFICPVCLKGFSDSNLQTIHMKTCAAKHNISTKKLIEAAKLQERQSEERLAIGLPGGPSVQPKRKTSNIKKMIPEGTADMHLALALSESLREHEERQEFDEAVALAAETDSKILDMTSSQRKNTLQSFGFVSKKPLVLPAVEKVKRKKLVGPTVLQTRSQEVRERILSDKIAQVLIGTESLTQQQMADENQINADFEPLNLHSHKLKEMQKKPDNIWTSSTMKKKHSQYYVKDLQPFITPKTDLDEENMPEDPEIHEQPVEPVEPMKTDVKRVELLPEIVSEPPKMTKSCVDMEYSDCLALDWSKMINSKSCSDVIIFLKDNKCIYCHWVVLLARCPRMTKDFLPNDDPEAHQRFKIAWSEMSNAGATAFMEFVYCGRLLNPEILDKREILNEVMLLADKYECPSVVDYLDKKILEMSKNLFTNAEKCTAQLSEREEMPQELEAILEISDDAADDDEKLQKSPEPIKNSIFLDETRMSPDIFAGMDSMPGTPEPTETSGCDKISDLIETSPKNLEKSENISVSIGSKKDEELKETPKRTIRRSLTCPEVLTGRKSPEFVARSDMSLFIAKVQRRNARGPFESDTEEDSPLDVKIRRGKNPFLVRKRLEDSSLSLSTKTQTEGKSTVKKSALTMFEDEIRAHLKKSEIIEEPDKMETSENLSENEKDESTGDLNKNLSNLSSSIASDVDLDESMYTKYKKTHGDNNSIADYREILTNFKSQVSENSKNDSNSHDISAINKQRLAELSAFDVYSSMAVNRSSEMSHEDLSTSQRSLDLSQRLSQTSIDLTQEFADKNAQNKFQSSAELSNESSKKLSLTESNRVEDLDFPEWGSPSGDNFFPLTQRARSTTPEISPEEKEDIKIPSDTVDLTLSDEEDAAEPCTVFQKFTSLPLEGVSDILQDCGLLNMNYSEESCKNNKIIIPNSSPIHVSSDSEAGSAQQVKSPFATYEDDFAMNFATGFDDFIAEGEMTTPPKSFWDEVQRPSTSRKSLNFDNVTFRSRKPPEKLQKNPPNIVTTISSDSDDDFPSFNLARMSSQPETQQSPPRKSDTLLLKTKSKSEGDFSIRKQVNKSLKITKRSGLKIFNYLNLSPSEAEISLSIAPKEDYNNLSPTTLNERLARYGLRAQKSHRAVELLNYIYNQLYPEIPVNILSQNGISDDELSQHAVESEDPKDIQLIDENSESDRESVGDLELSGEEYDDEDVSHVEKLFKKLLEKDRQLYNQVLMYKPLPLESLHEKLKNIGVKSGPKVLANYLDDEGISFYIEFPKRKGKNKK